jgi:hypothetical protein
MVLVYHDDVYGSATVMSYLIDTLTTSSSGVEVPYHCTLPTASF